MKIIKIKGAGEDQSIFFVNTEHIMFVVQEENLENVTRIRLRDNAVIYSSQSVKEIVELIRKGE